MHTAHHDSKLWTRKNPLKNSSIFWRGLRIKVNDSKKQVYVFSDIFAGMYAWNSFQYFAKTKLSMIRRCDSLFTIYNEIEMMKNSSKNKNGMQKQTELKSHKFWSRKS